MADVETRLAGWILDLLHPNSPLGGVEGLLQLAEANGLGEQAQSWVGTGPNQAVSPEQIKALFSDPRVVEAMKQSGSPGT